MNLIRLVSITALALTMTISVSAQVEITGIGKVKIDMDFDLAITELGIKAKDLVNPNEKKTSWLDVYRVEENYILEYDSVKTPKDLRSLYEMCPNTKVLLAKKYEVAGIKIEGLQLKFYEGKLVSIYILSPSLDFRDAIRTKYGDGDLKTERKEVKCTSIYGETTYEEVKYKTFWNKDQDIETVSYLSKYRDSKCKEQFLSYFQISRPEVMAKIMKCSVATWEREDQNDAKQKKEKLADF